MSRNYWYLVGAVFVIWMYIRIQNYIKKYGHMTDPVGTIFWLMAPWHGV